MADKPSKPVIAARLAARAARRGRERLVGPTRQSSLFWKHRQEHEPGIFDGWWATRDLAYRQTIVDRVAPLGADTLLEVGTGCGMNLAVIHERLPELLLVGTDINAAALAYARGKDVKARLLEATADQLPFPDAHFDVVLTAVVLCCIGPDRYPATIAELKRVTRHDLILLETQADRTIRDPYPNTTYWWRDYTRDLPGATVDELAGDVAHGHVRHLIHWRKPS